MVIREIPDPQEVRSYYRNGKTELLEIPGTENNMVYEAREFLRLIEEKDYNHKYLENSRLEMELMDEVRRQQEIVFPADKIRGFLLYMDKMAIMTVDDFGKRGRQNAVYQSSSARQGNGTSPGTNRSRGGKYRVFYCGKSG